MQRCSPRRRRELGRIDVLVNNAGLGGTAELVDMTDEQWSSVLDVTLTGTFRCTACRRCATCWRAGPGVIVNNASVLGWRAQAGQAHYAAAKAGVMALTRCAAIEAAAVRGAGQRGRAEPGHAPVPGQGHERGAAARAHRAARRSAAYAEPWEVANVIVFLASDYSSYITGEVVSGQQPARLTADGRRDGSDRARRDRRGAGGESAPTSATATGSRSPRSGSTASPTRPATTSGSTSTWTARAGPFGGPIAHGYLTVALSNLFLPQIVEVRGVSLGVNYGCDQIRFPHRCRSGPGFEPAPS